MPQIPSLRLFALKKGKQTNKQTKNPIKTCTVKKEKNNLKQDNVHLDYLWCNHALYKRIMVPVLLSMKLSDEACLGLTFVKRI